MDLFYQNPPLSVKKETDAKQYICSASAGTLFKFVNSVTMGNSTNIGTQLNRGKNPSGNAKISFEHHWIL